MVCLQPDVSTSVVQIDDIKIMLKDRHSKKIMDTAQAFRGIIFEENISSYSCGETYCFVSVVLNSCERISKMND